MKRQSHSHVHDIEDEHGSQHTVRSGPSVVTGFSIGGLIGAAAALR
jgi:hypothetical protein